MLALLLTALIAGRLAAQPASHRPAIKSSDNAALVYWQAIALMPELTEAQDEAVGNWRSAEANPVRADLVNKIEPVIRLMMQGAAKEHADWGIDFSPGPHTLLPHLQQVRRLSRLGLAAATQKMQENKPQEAAEIAIAVMRMGRHIAPAGTLIEMLVQVAIQDTATAWIARHAPRMTPEARKYILAELDRLPPAATTASSMKGETLFLDWARKQFEAGRVEAIHDLASGEGIEAQVKGLQGADRKQLLQWLDEAEAWYQEAVAAAQQPYPQVRDAVAKVLEKVEASDNQLAKVFFPSIERVWIIEHRAQANLAMLRAGLEKLNGGRQMARDPYGDGAFKVVDHAGGRGFTLHSDLRMDNKPVELVFGAAPESR